MSAAKSTPGPWTLERNHFGYAIYGPPGTEPGTPGIRIVCEVRTQGHADGVALANAQLLLTAIEPRYTHADVAAAHAEGYKLGVAQHPSVVRCVNAHDELVEALLGCIAVIERTAHCTEADRLAAADMARAAIAKAGSAALAKAGSDGVPSAVEATKARSTE